MKKLWVIFLFFVIALPVCAELTTKKVNNLPEGVFKKTRGGEYVQLDKKGKKWLKVAYWHSEGTPQPDGSDDPGVWETGWISESQVE